MSSLLSTGQNYTEWSDKQMQELFEGKTETNTAYVKEQLEFMESVSVGYSDGTTTGWGEDAPEQYEVLVDSFGETDEYVTHLDDGSVIFLVEQENEPLFAVYGEEQTSNSQSKFGLSGVMDILSG